MKEASAETKVVDASFVAGAVDQKSLPPPTSMEIAFAGRSNVGKSSLLNALMQRRGLARTSNTPGCTRQLNVFEVRCADGLTLHFVDLPGYGWARRSKTERSEWQTMIEGYLTRRTGLRAVVLLVDVRRGVEEEERQLVEFLRLPRAVSEATPLETIWVATKIDKLGVAARKPALEKLRRDALANAPGGSRERAREVAALASIIGFSSVTGAGCETLWQRVRGAAFAGRSGLAGKPSGGSASASGATGSDGGDAAFAEGAPTKSNREGP